MPEQPFLSVVGVSKSLTSADGRVLPVNRDVTLTVVPGEFVSIVGPSGAGKTTLLRTLGGLTAFEEARARSLTRLGAGPAGPGSRLPLLWTDGALAKTREIFGCEPWPYGVEANRRTLDAFARWAHEQGVARRLLAADEMFPESLRSPSRI